MRLVRTAQTAQTVSPYIQECGVGSPLSPGSCPESESDSECASKSRTPTPGTRPVSSSVVLDTNGRSVDRLLIKNVKNFYFLFDGFPYVIAPVFSTPAFSICAIYSCIFYSRIFSALSVSRGQCNATPAITLNTFSALGHHCYLASSKLYRLSTEA